MSFLEECNISQWMLVIDEVSNEQIMSTLVHSVEEKRELGLSFLNTFKDELNVGNMLDSDFS